jgi:hypothetical protein
VPRGRARDRPMRQLRADAARVPDECLVESLDALRTARSETEPRALSTLASIRDSLLILLDAVDRARDRVLAAGAKTNGAKLN